MRRSGDWVQYRGDEALTGRSALIGDIKHPCVEWEKFIGARETLLALTVDDLRSANTWTPGTVTQHSDLDVVRREWGFDSVWHDLDATGEFTSDVPGCMHKTGKFIPGDDRYYRLSFTQLPSTPGVEHKCLARLHLRQDGEWCCVWERNHPPKPYGIHPIVGDFDGDGRVEFAIAPIDDIYVHDLLSGEQKAKARFVQPGMESGRSYGWFGAFDVDGDGRKEFVLIGDHQEHVDVLGWRDGRFELWWNWVIEEKVTAKNSLLRMGVNPVADVDGDGLPEIVVSVFNHEGDNRWHTIVMDGRNGERKFDIRDRYVVGMLDVDGDGAHEIFCVETPASRLIPDPGELSIVSCHGGRLSVKWGLSGSAFETHCVPDYPFWVNSGSATGRLTLLGGPIEVGGLPVFVTRKSPELGRDDVELTVWQSSSEGHIRQLGTVRGPHLNALATKPGTGLLIQAPVIGEANTDVRFAGLEGKIICSWTAAPYVSPPVVARLSPGRPPVVVVQTQYENVVAFCPETASRQAEPLWRRPGRGMHVGMHIGALVASQSIFDGVSLADLTGNGELATIVATRGPIGQARMVALDPRGDDIWHADFDDYPGEPPAWNHAGIIYWFTGHFTSKDHCDVIVNVRQSQDGLLYLLDGRTGRVIWRRKEIEVSEGRTAHAGGAWMSIYDHDGDGLDDALCGYYSILSVLRGATGELIMLKDTGPKGILHGLWTSGWQQPVADLLGNGRKQILHWTAHVQAVIEADGTPVWCEVSALAAGTYTKAPEIIWHETAFVPAPNSLPGIADVDGDGSLEIVSVGTYPNRSEEGAIVRCGRASNGETKWEIAIPAVGSPGSCASADIDGDGREEVIFAVGRTLCCVGVDTHSKSGVLKWTLDMPDTLGCPAIADTDGSGKAKIVVTCADGCVYGIGSAGGGS